MRRAGSLGAVALVALAVVLAQNVVESTDTLLPAPTGTRPHAGAATADPATPGGAAPDPAPDAAPGDRSRLPAQGPPDPQAWAGTVSQSVDTTTLTIGGLTLPEGANVFAARIFGGGPSPAYRFYEAGGGAFSEDFYPASSIKVLAALGALDFLRSLGLDGAATIDDVVTVRDIYDAAIRYSSNADYSALVRIAGLDRLNSQFLPTQGYRATVIQEAYGGDEQVGYTPALSLAEDDRTVDVDARMAGDDDYGCGGRNCSNLFELADAVRRVVLEDQLPATERFPIAQSDVAGLQDSLLGSSSWVGPGVRDALGPDALIYSKPGWVPGLDCVDVAVVVDPVSSARYLLGVSMPDREYDGCDGIGPIAHDVLAQLAGEDAGVAVRSDGSEVDVAGGRQVALRP